MNILFIHKGFPGQFKHLIKALSIRGDEIVAISTKKKVQKIYSNCELIHYVPRRANGRDTFPLASEIETKIIRGEAVANIADKLSAKGYVPSLIIGHPGWGEMLFLADIWPNTPQIHYTEFFHGVPGTDNDIDDIYSKNKSWEEKAKDRVKNTHLLANLNQMSVGICPTHFQFSLLPRWAQKRTTIIHDGIDTDWLTPDPSAILNTKNGNILKAGDPIITFVNRTFEPYRGIHIFLNALITLQKSHKTCQVVLVGADTPEVSYGANRNDQKGWLTALRDELGDHLDWSRIHILGQIPHSELKIVYQISAAHVYLSYPFVLSWSMLEAMSCGSLIIGSKTAPVEEIITDRTTGLLVPFSDDAILSSILLDALSNPKKYYKMRVAARRLIKEKYQLKSCLKKQIEIINKVTNNCI